MKDKMINRRMYFFLIVLLTALLAGFGQSAVYGQGIVPRSREDIIEDLMAGMSPEEKIGQLMIVGIHGQEVDEEISSRLKQYHFGGIILFDKNLETEKQVEALTRDLQEAGSGEMPLFIAIDEEGGQVARMRQVVEAPPAALELGATDRPELAENWAEKTGRRLRSLGFNVNFAPVADLGSFKARHFSTDPAKTSLFVQAASNGYRAAGIVHALKHFPGLGKGEVDTHIGRAVVNISRRELEEEDLRPFRETIKANGDCHDSFMVMLTHAVYPQLTGELPASISPEACNLLRDELGFKGLIITDGLEMAGAAVAPFRELGVRALKAGVDIMLVCHGYEHEEEVYLGLLDALRVGEITQERVDESVRRVIAAKLWLTEQGNIHK
ncbi:MAG: glycoside hydrolase family 3 protein [Selenomonadaceae bacterium]|nr:glycoside hydrolase family 3 protein [Selenomonadaceae bacterium]